MTPETMVASLEAHMQAERLVEEQQLQTASDHGIEYFPVNRGENLRLLRAYFNSTQDEFFVPAPDLKSVSIQANRTRRARTIDE